MYASHAGKVDIPDRTVHLRCAPYVLAWSLNLVGNPSITLFLTATTFHPDLRLHPSALPTHKCSYSSRSKRKSVPRPNTTSIVSSISRSVSPLLKALDGHVYFWRTGCVIAPSLSRTRTSPLAGELFPRALVILLMRCG